MRLARRSRALSLMTSAAVCTAQSSLLYLRGGLLRTSESQLSARPTGSQQNCILRPLQSRRAATNPGTALGRAIVGPTSTTMTVFSGGAAMPENGALWWQRERVLRGRLELEAVQRVLRPGCLLCGGVRSSPGSAMHAPVLRRLASSRRLARVFFSWSRATSSCRIFLRLKRRLLALAPLALFRTIISVGCSCGEVRRGAWCGCKPRARAAPSP